MNTWVKRTMNPLNVQACRPQQNFEVTEQGGIGLNSQVSAQTQDNPLGSRIHSNPNL